MNLLNNDEEIQRCFKELKEQMKNEKPKNTFRIHHSVGFKDIISEQFDIEHGYAVFYNFRRKDANDTHFYRETIACIKDFNMIENITSV